MPPTDNYRMDDIFVKKWADLIRWKLCSDCLSKYVCLHSSVHRHEAGGLLTPAASSGLRVGIRHFPPRYDEHLTRAMQAQTAVPGFRGFHSIC